MVVILFKWRDKNRENGADNKPIDPWREDALKDRKVIQLTWRKG